MARSSAGSTRKRTTSRELRSASPVKMPPPTSAPATESPSRPKATPRSRKPKNKKTTPSSDSRAASAALAAVVDATPPSVADSEEEEAAAETVANAVSTAIADAAEDKENALPSPNAARVTVTSDVIDDDGVETTRTQVQVELPGDVPGEPIPETAEDALENAKQIVADAKAVQEAQQTNGEVTESKPKSRKRKASEADLEIKSPEEEIVEELLNGDAPIDGVTAKEEVITADGEVAHVEFGARDGEPARKRTRVMVPADEFRRQKMQKRALMGLSATLAVGAMIPFVSSLF